MRRREFISLVGGATVIFPLVARAQQSAMPVIGVLNSGAEQLRPDQFDGLHRGLKEAGFVAGANVTVVYRGADDAVSGIAVRPPSRPMKSRRLIDAPEAKDR